jgi:galactonate dehydratase
MGTDMKIARIETFQVPPRWLFVRVETDSGLTGWGEPVVEGRADVVRSAVDVCAEYLIGKDPFRIEDHWNVLSKAGFYRGGPILSSAVAGLDQALWDIAGKALGVPIHQMLGGFVRDRVRVYGWVGGDDFHELSDQIRARLEVGLTAVKLNASGPMTAISSMAELDAVVRRVEAVREILGPTRDLAIDFHGRFTLANAKRLARLLEPSSPLFIEEPVVPEKSHLIREVVDATTVPIATGERLYSRAEFLGVLQAGISVAQPDLSHAGGITETKKIAALAEIFDAQLAPHCPLGPIALAACLQIGFAVPNYLIQEQSVQIHYNREADLLDYLLDTSPLQFRDGCIHRLTQPGLGLELDEKAIRAASARGHTWRTPMWRHPDGALAEW